MTSFPQAPTTARPNTRDDPDIGKERRLAEAAALLHQLVADRADLRAEQKRLDEKTRQGIVTAAQAGMSALRIAKHLHMSRRPVTAIVSAARTTPPIDGE